MCGYSWGFLGRGVKRQWGCRRRHFIGYFGGYVFGN